ncbi:unnamed protein product [Protopolystoma xenopodis]|uniref:Uncharacterized protein n=1 Tax=Protopolystoma xenopodis TaxID=117903 RepID=A0A3S4ZVX2_9PLAT|nr:unnamed protein product [Protopolystoma xenopodis]
MEAHFDLIQHFAGGSLLLTEHGEAIYTSAGRLAYPIHLESGQYQPAVYLLRYGNTNQTDKVASNSALQRTQVRESGEESCTDSGRSLKSRPKLPVTENLSKPMLASEAHDFPGVVVRGEGVMPNLVETVDAMGNCYTVDRMGRCSITLAGK